MDDIILVMEFNNHAEAEMAKERLESYGINSIIHSDDCGGMAGGQTFIRGVQLLVSKNDIVTAKKILKIISK